MTNEERTAALRATLKAIYETVEETTRDGNICPEGVMFAALQDSMTVEQYNTIVTTMKEIGILSRGPYAHTVTVTDANRAIAREIFA